MIKTQFKGFVDFVRTQGVVGLAVGLILGGAVTTLVGSFIRNIVNPLLGILLGHAKNLGDISFNILGAKVMYGALALDIINFLVIALVVYFGIKQLGLDRLDKPKS